MIKPPISPFSLNVLTRFTGVVCPLVRLWTPWILCMLLILLLQGRTAVISVLREPLVQLPTVLKLLQLRPAVHLHHPFAGTMPSSVPRPSVVKLHVPGRETRAPAGGCFFPACRFNGFCSHLSPWWSLQPLFSSWYWGFNLGFPVFNPIFNLWCSATHGWWVNFNLLWFQNYPSTVWNVELFLDFPTGSSFCSNPWSRFSSISFLKSKYLLSSYLNCTK